MENPDALGKENNAGVVYLALELSRKKLPHLPQFRAESRPYEAAWCAWELFYRDRNRWFSKLSPRPNCAGTRQNFVFEQKRSIRVRDLPC